MAILEGGPSTTKKPKRANANRWIENVFEA